MKEKLLNIQQELKCNKGQYNSFGQYKYRSCEGILESVKPLLKENKCILTLSDELEYIGERYYIKAIATITDVETGDVISNTAYAREEETKKGMDGSQLTGTSSSYARKYALNGLFAIDDTKDADTDEYTKQTKGVKEEDTTDYRSILAAELKQQGLLEEYAKTYKLNAKTPQSKCKELLGQLKGGN